MLSDDSIDSIFSDSPVVIFGSLVNFIILQLILCDVDLSAHTKLYFIEFSCSLILDYMVCLSGQLQKYFHTSENCKIKQDREEKT